MNDEDNLIGEPGWGWLSWTDNPDNYIRNRTLHDPWAAEEGAPPEPDTYNDVAVPGPASSKPCPDTSADPEPVSPLTHIGAPLPWFDWIGEDGHPGL